MFVISFATLVCTAAARPSLNYLENHFTAENEPEEVRSAAIKRLLEVFGMELTLLAETLSYRSDRTKM